MASTRKCKYGRNESTGKCNPKGRDCKNGRNATTGKCNKKIEILLPLKEKKQKKQMERQAKYHEDFPGYIKYFKKSHKKVEEYLKKHKNKYQLGDIFHLNDGWGDDDFQIVLGDGEYTSCSYDGMETILCPIIMTETNKASRNKFIQEGVKYDTILKQLEKDASWNPFIYKYNKNRWLYDGEDEEPKYDEDNEEPKLDYYDWEPKTYEDVVEIYRRRGLLLADSSYVSESL
jgi:hypothetical protein